MKLVKASKRQKPKVSLILLDWEVRESFHLCHYLAKQNVPRDDFEVVLVEYYSKISPAVKQFEDQIDTWCLLEMPEDSYYHKHLMYNIGFLLSHGDIIVICDSDAMVKPTFIENILKHFEKEPQTVLHLDQFRNHSREYYPFNYPSFNDVIGYGCVNYENGVTSGISASEDLIHKRNYGACFCCTRKDFIEIGGADEHIDYVGHICGPYDLTFRLINQGRKEVWHTLEFLYHTWHPGTDGTDNYMGPHDGYNMSTNSLEALFTKRTLPNVINPLVEKVQKGETVSIEDILAKGISEENFVITQLGFLESKSQVKKWSRETRVDLLIDDYVIRKNNGRFGVYSLSKTHSRRSSEPVEIEFSHANLNKAKKYAHKQLKNKSIKNGLVISIKLLGNYSIRLIQKWKHIMSQIHQKKNLLGLRVHHIKTISKMRFLPWTIFKNLNAQKKDAILLVDSQRDFYVYQEMMRAQQALFQNLNTLLKQKKSDVKIRLVDHQEIPSLLPDLTKQDTVFITPSAYHKVEKTLKENNIELTVI